MFRLDHPGPALPASIERQVLAVSPDATVLDQETLGTRLLDTVRDRSLVTLISTFFAVTVVIISATGLFGVVAFTIARRRREIAIRLAVGASVSRMWSLVTRDTLAAVATGMLIGLIVGAWASSAVEHLLFGIKPADPGSLALAAIGMLLTSFGASLWPVSRTMRRPLARELRAD